MPDAQSPWAYPKQVQHRAKLTKLDIRRVSVDRELQPRARIEARLVAEYVAALQAGATFPPLVVFGDGTDYWLADGFHRYAAYRQAGVRRASAELHRGTRREAQLFAVGANARHGLRRSKADKRRAVETLLRDEEWCQWSNREIARRCAVSYELVVALRGELGLSVISDRYVQRGDSVYAMQTAGISRANTQRASTRRSATAGGSVTDHQRTRSADADARCSRCGRGLSDPESIALGIGPECRANGKGRRRTSASGDDSAAGIETQRAWAPSPTLTVLDDLVHRLQQALAEIQVVPAVGGYVWSEQTMRQLHTACANVCACISTLTQAPGPDVAGALARSHAQGDRSEQTSASHVREARARL